MSFIHIYKHLALLNLVNDVIGEDVHLSNGSDVDLNNILLLLFHVTDLGCRNFIWVGCEEPVFCFY
uniref:Uncharacterized protein n=1 Tax=Chenopodium quinoa TaxID=63459 RepID=A0A803M1J8_CHEQI